MDDKEALLACSTVLLAMLSLIACIFVCVSICKKGYTPCTCCIPDTIQLDIGLDEALVEVLVFPHKKKPNTNEPNIIVFWMCVVDGFHMIPIIINWTPQFFQYHNWFWNNTTCTIIGVMAQFCAIQGASFHILLALVTGYLLCGGNMQHKLNKMYNQRYIHFTFMNIIPLIGTIIPFFMNSSNGYAMSEMNGDLDCWVIGDSQYIFIIIIIISLISHYIVLLIAAIQFRRSKKDEIIIKLSKFVVVYTIVRFFPLIERIYGILADIPYWLALLQHWSIAALGMANALVWFWNSSNDGSKENRKSKFNFDFGRNKKKKKTTLQSTSSGNCSINTTNTDDTSINMKNGKKIIGLQNGNNYQWRRIGEKNTYNSNKTLNVNLDSNEKKKDEASDITGISSNNMNKSNSIMSHNVYMTNKKSSDKRILL